MFNNLSWLKVSSRRTQVGLLVGGEWGRGFEFGEELSEDTKSAYGLDSSSLAVMWSFVCLGIRELEEGGVVLLS